MSTGVRVPAAAGSFYPDDPARLARDVDALLHDATRGPEPLDRRPWAIVVPHAGYRFSGMVAAAAYVAVLPWAERMARVLLMGPAHFVPLGGCAVPGTRAWATPLGDVEIDEELCSAAVEAGCAIDDLTHAPEHSLEVQLPFLQRACGPAVRVLPVAVGASEPEDVAGVLSAVDAAVDLVIVSTDLSHYLDDGTARARDRRTADAVSALDVNGIGSGDACGFHALRGALLHARMRGGSVRLLDLRTSADSGADVDRVVGYGAFAIA